MSTSSSIENIERNCALCLDTLPPKTDSKVCKKCYEKHNNQVKFTAFHLTNDAAVDQTTKEITAKLIADSLPEHYCNLCQKSLNTAIELEEHLIEHSFRGCEERGYNCYICSAIFTLPSGLHQHMIEHGPSYRPYDCSLCAKKFYFRAELENHLIDHENGRIPTSIQPSQTDLASSSSTSNEQKQINMKREHDNNEYNNQTNTSNDDDADDKKDSHSNSSHQEQQNSCETNADDDDEYIEVEQIGEHSTINHDTHDDIKRKQHSERNDEYDKND